MKENLLTYDIQATVQIPVAQAVLSGDLWIPKEAKGIVLFAHGTGSSRKSPRNRFVAQFLNRSHIGTLLMDLLTEEEERDDWLTREHRFDIDLLANRLVEATDWLKKGMGTSSYLIGYFGASTGAAAALVAACRRPKEVEAVVSRGGRPDLAGFHLKHVLAPTLLIVGSEDKDVVRLNRVAYEELKGRKSIHIVPGLPIFSKRPAL